MKILTILTLTVELLSPFNVTRIAPSYINVTNNTAVSNLVQVQTFYNVADPSATVGISDGLTIEEEVPIVYVADIYVNFQHTVDSAYIKLEFKKPSSTVTMNYIGQNIRVDQYGNNSQRSFLYFYVYETNSAHLQVIFTLKQLHDYYGYTNPTTYNDIINPAWIRNNTYFYVTSAEMNSCILDTEIDYTSYIDGIEGTLNTINSNIDGVEALLNNLITEADEIETLLTTINNSVNGLKTLQFYGVPEYSWSAYYLFKRKWTLKYDNTFPRPYVTTTNDSASSFSWDDAIQIQDRDLYIVLATFGYSSSTLPVKIIKSNNTDVTSQFTWTYRYTGRYRFYYVQIPSDLFNNALNIKWTAEINVMPVYLGRLRNMPFEVSELCNIDANNQIVRILNDLKSAINNINVTNNTTVNQINTEVNDYNTTINNVYNIENNLNTNLQSALAQYSPDNSSVLNKLQYSTVVYSNILGRLNNISVFALPLAVALAGIILISVLG